MRPIFVILLLFFPLIETRLRFVQVFFRHGQRFPTTYMSFPTENANLSAAENLDRGELTNAGIRQAYTLGQNLREYYSDFVGPVYHASNLITYSGRDNRTVASALATLAGFFPPSSNQTWSRNLPWIPIPVFAAEWLDDASFGILDNCPYYVRTAFNVSIDRGIFDRKYRLLAEELSVKTGVPINDLDRLQKVVDGILSRSQFDGMYPLPAWANSSAYINRLRYYQSEFHRDYIPTLLPDTGAWLFDQVVGAFDEFAANRTEHKMVLYSGHDTNMMTLGIYLNISKLNETLQPMSTYLAFELWDSPNGSYVVNAFLHDKLNGTRHKLEIGLCREPCYFDKFRGIVQRLSTQDFSANCKDLGSQSTLFGSIAGILLVLLILLAAALIAAIWACLSWKRRYEQLADEEQRPLMHQVSVVRREDPSRK